MYQILYQRLTSIATCYEEIIGNGQVIYAHLQKRELEAIQPLQEKQFKFLQELEQLQSELKEAIIKFSSQFQLEEPRVQNLIPHLKEKEQAEIQQLRQQVMSLEQETRTICEQNGEFLRILLELSENVVGWLSQYSEEHGHGSQLFMDETL